LIIAQLFEKGNSNNLKSSSHEVNRQKGGFEGRGSPCRWFMIAA
jgi:hypothetical protein